MTDIRDPAEDDALAAEYVLGVLALAERLAVQDRLKADAGFAALVAKWEAHFEGLNAKYPEAPAPDLMPRIEARLFGPPAPVSAQRRTFWPRWALGLATAAVVALAVVTYAPWRQEPELVATLSAEAQPLVFAANWQDGALQLSQTAGPAAAAGHAYQLWLIVGEAAPVSLGVLEAASVTRLLPALPEGAVLAISLEPEGGSTTGAPTGPVLVTGVVTIG